MRCAPPIALPMSADSLGELFTKSNHRTLGQFLTRCIRGFPLTLSVAARAAKSKSATQARLLAFDFAPLRSGRAVMEPPPSEGMSESYVD